MPYVRSKRNIRRPRRARRSVRRRPATRSYTRRRTTTRVAASRRQKPCVCPGDLSPAAKFALAQMDPFEIKCLGAKVPDSNTIPSIANADTDQVALAAPSTNGNLIAAAFFPSYAAAFISATDGASNVTWSNTYASRRNYLNVVNSIEAIRPVAHALRISSPLAPTSATGFVHVGLAVESRLPSGASTSVIDLPTNVNGMTGLAHYARFTLASLTQSPLTVINKWIDETGFRYDDPRSTPIPVTTGTTPTDKVGLQPYLQFGQSWATIVVMVEGQSTGASPISFEHILLTECIPRKDSFILGSPAAPHSPGTMSAVSAMTSETGFAHTEAGQESYVQQSLNAFAQGANVAGERVFQQVALPLIQQAGYAAVGTGITMAMNAIRGTGGIPGVNANPTRLALT